MAIQRQHIPALAQLFGAMGNRTRLKILMELQKGPLKAGTVVRRLRMPQPTVSHHLSLLRQAKLVIARRNGRQIIYSLNNSQARSERTMRAISGRAGGLKIGPLVFGTVKG